MLNNDDLDRQVLALDETRIPRQRFQLEAFADITVGNGPECLIADIVPAAGFTVIFGEAGSTKSFLASDMGLAVALEQPWAGKEVLGGTVCYVTAEGASGFRKRLVAYRQHYGISDVPVPFYVIADTPDLGHSPGDVSALIGAIETQAGRPVRAVIVDTLARVMHGADENSAADMGLFADHCARIGKELGCAVIALHHCGKDSGRGARGSSALRAAADCEILVDGTQERRTATVTKAKDGDDGWTLEYRLNRVEIETPDGRELSSCTLETLGDWTLDNNKPAPKRKLSDRQKLALDALGNLVLDGQPLPGEWGLPAGLVGTATASWKDELYRRGILDKEAKNPRADFRDLKTALQARSLIAERDGVVWKTGQ